MPRILIIDDDCLVCQSLSLLATRMGHEAMASHTIAEGLKKAAAEPFDVLFLDVRLPDGSGLDILPQLERLPMAPEIIVMTGYGDPLGAELAIRNGVWDYLEKGATPKEITLALDGALLYRKQKLTGYSNGNLIQLKREEIVGNSPRLQACLEQVAQAGTSEASVLIIGETGTGKELIARAVHQNSCRANMNFVVVDCAALTETLIESMLFGHEKGSFTGADHAREGLILQANGGTLFLDEIGELPLTLQRAFLRVLQEHKFRPLGSNHEVESHFRLVSATNRDLDKMVKNDQFRGDLLFRLRSLVIELPGLRERPEDLQPLLRHYTALICEQIGIPAKGFSSDFLKNIISYTWPGNVRELINTLEQTISAARYEPILFPKHLPIRLRIEVVQATIKHDSSKPTAADRMTPRNLPRLQDFRDSVWSHAEKEYLQDLMAISANDISTACQVSGLSHSRLYALLKNQGITLQH